MLKIHDSLSGKKQAFAPIHAPDVRMYVCGLTVYDYMHLGHARMLVVFDTVARWLRASGYRLTYVRNITDIDDKIIRRAAENHESIQQLTERFIRFSHEDEAALGVLRPDLEPRATQSIDAIVRMVQTLLDKGFAYQGPNGDMYYAVNRFKNYGQLSGKRPEDLRAGARVEVDESKRDPLDFVLWKAAKPGEPAWPSPWGAGRPGWHIECSAMSTAALGNHFDIHGGGMDLQFPHHENEIAQSEAATDEPFVNLWMHNGFVNVDEEKMSKSLGNFFTVREVLKKYRPEVVRYFILNSHYRSPLNYSGMQLDQARASLTTLYMALRGVTEGTIEDAEPSLMDLFKQAMDDDFNTPNAIRYLFILAGDINVLRTQLAEGAGNFDIAHAQRVLIGKVAQLRYLGRILGILQLDPEIYLQGGIEELRDFSPTKIESMIAARNAARKIRNWKEADRIRDELAANGILIEDSDSGTTWRRK